MKSLAIYLTFARPFAIPMLATTVCCCYCIFRFQSPAPIYTFIWLKGLLSLVLFYAWHNIRANQLIYYANLGFSFPHLIVATQFIDIFTYVLITGLCALCI